MIDYTFEELVRKYVNFRHGVMSNGWNMAYCEVCGDGSRTKGPRGGWLFSDGGDTGFFHCFNCGCKGNFSLNREHIFSKDMRNILDSFGIPSKEYNMLFFAKERTAQHNKPVAKKNSIQTIEIPPYFKNLHSSNTTYSKQYKRFLNEKYKLSSLDYSFYYVEDFSDATALKFKDRLIIPYFKQGKMIFYEARDITDKSKNKYISAPIPKANILFNIDSLYLNTDEPLYIVEGALDALHLNGIATLGNEMTPQQIEAINNSKRKKILIPDFGGDSKKLLEQAIKEDYYISIPEYGKRCKDVSEAIVNFGKLYVAHDIAKNTMGSIVARLKLPLLGNL